MQFTAMTAHVEIDCRKDTSGNYYAQACKTVEEGKFKTAEVSESDGKDRDAKHSFIRRWQIL